MLTPFASLLGDRRVVLVDWYGYGEFGLGVLWAAIEDSAGSCAHVCIDNRQHSETRGRLFDGARHPNQPESRLIGIGDATEGDVVSLLSAWCDNSGNWTSQGGKH